MDEQPQEPADLLDFAKVLVKQLVRERRLRWDESRLDDAVQTLVLAGLDDWNDTHDIGLAMNRMRSRQRNLLRDYCRERAAIVQSETCLPEPSEGMPSLLERDKRRHDQTDDPAVSAVIENCLAPLTERQRQIVEMRFAEYTIAEIAHRLGISQRTVERELTTIRKENDDGSS